MFTYGEKLVYINKKYPNDYNNKYSIVTFLVDRPDMEEVVVEQLASGGLFRFYKGIPYTDIEKLGTLLSFEDAISIIKAEISQIENKKNRLLPDIKYLQIYLQLDEEIRIMENNLDRCYYSASTRELIRTSIKQKEKGMRRIKKHTKKFFNNSGETIDNLSIYDYPSPNDLKDIARLERFLKEITPITH